MPSNKYKTFFQKTGKVLFAIAMADKKLDEKEYETIQKLVQDEWRLSCLNEEDIKHISQMKNVFDWLIENPNTEDEILKEYESFKNENPAIFIPEIKDFVYKTANRVAASYANKNKSELVLLAKLHFILKK